MKEIVVIKDFKNDIGNKRVLFITTKELSYLRNVQEINYLKKDSKRLRIIGSENKKYLFRLIKVYSQILQLEPDEFDTVFIGFSPQLILPLFYWKFRKKEIIIDFFISAYDTFVNDRKIVTENNILAKIMYKLDRITLKWAKHIVVDTKADLNYFSKEFECERNKFSVLYLEANKEIFYPRPQNKPDDLKDKFVVLYFGSILPLQGVDIVLETIKLLENERSIFFQIIGPIPEKYEKPIQNNVEYIEWLNQDELANYIANSDLCLAGHFSGKIDKAKRTIAGKAYIYYAMGKPVILGECEANKERFSKSDLIYFVRQGSPVALKTKIMELVHRFSINDT